MSEGVVEVFDENWTAVQVYVRCQMTVIAVAGIGGGRLIYRGVSAQEAGAAARLLRVPRREWPDVLARVQIMGAAAANYLNDRRA